MSEVTVLSPQGHTGTKEREKCLVTNARVRPRASQGNTVAGKAGG